MAIVQVIARHSLRSPNAAPEVLAFESRIDAIVRTHTRLLSENERAGELEEIVRQTIAPFLGPEQDRVTIQGPPLRLRPKVVTALAMALHELATNAVKYGALSNQFGLVDIHWEVTDETFDFWWTERGGPPVVAPTTKGFGSLLISRVLQAETRGDITSDFDAHGYRLHLTARLDALVAIAAGPE
ncbi:hypothetical protein IC608_10385 [Devosia sp. PTR5]|uniref:histidine kinase n=1 Tax=Devosia oryzisoli TaxID=2774138 RepID=A0A927ITJ5_9HYPH|nr:HWE histidine kinase domain-containing protein [Devosia oryzisoli]MBD8065883.1 hypothetical protein [Devosia oryzisoli]